MTAAIATKEAVFAAADQLASRGEKVTLDKLRAAVGGGSLSTISDLCSQWRQAQASSKPALPATEPAPAAVNERMSALMATAWSEALAMANARLEGERSALAATRTTLEAEKREALESGDVIAAQLDDAKEAIASLQAADAENVKELDRLRQRLAESQAESQAIAAAKGELAGILATAHADLKASQAEVARLTGALMAAQTQAAADSRTVGHRRNRTAPDAGLGQDESGTAQ